MALIQHQPRDQKTSVLDVLSQVNHMLNSQTHSPWVFGSKRTLKSVPQKGHLLVTGILFELHMSLLSLPSLEHIFGFHFIVDVKLNYNFFLASVELQFKTPGFKRLASWDSIVSF